LEGAIKTDSPVSAAQPPGQKEDRNHDGHRARTFSVHMGYRPQDNARALTETILRAHWRERDQRQGNIRQRFVANAN
jgi:hypothetical protein